MMLIAMVYSVVMMKIVHYDGTIYQGQAKLDQHVKRFYFLYIFIDNISTIDIDIFTEITIFEIYGSYGIVVTK